MDLQLMTLEKRFWAKVEWLANLYKVSYGQIRLICNGQSWGHI
jgi:hypothetical protein